MISKLTKEELEALIHTEVDKLLKDVYNPGPLLKGLNMNFEIMDEGVDSNVLHIWDYAWIVIKVKDTFIKITGRLESDGDRTECNRIYLSLIHI